MSRRSILTMAAAGMTIMALTACGIVGDSRETSSIFGAVTEFASELKDGVFQEIRRRLPGAGEDSGGGTAQEGGTEKNPEDRQQEKLAELGQETLTVEEGEIRMESETEGEADLMVRLPDYEALFLEALNAEDPDAYLENALENGDYETKQVETRAQVTVEGGNQVVHSEEAAKEALEKELVQAIAALAGEENE
mgnify:FL=1